MIVYKCDRCHAEFAESNKLWSIALPHLSSNEIIFEDSYNRDLCYDCVQVVIDVTKQIYAKKKS